MGEQTANRTGGAIALADMLYRLAELQRDLVAHDMREAAGAVGVAVGLVLEHDDRKDASEGSLADASRIDARYADARELVA